MGLRLRDQPTTASDTPLFASLLGATTSAKLSPFAQHKRDRICIWRLVAREKRHRTTGIAKVRLPARRWWEERKRERRQICGRYGIEKEKPARETAREEIYLLRWAGSCPRKSGAIRCRRTTDRNALLTSSTLPRSTKQILRRSVSNNNR